MSSNSPLSNYTLFLDRNFGRIQVATAMRASGLQIETHYDHFPAAELGEFSDEYWISDVTQRDWIILTRDGHIRNNPLERRTFIGHAARVFNIRNANATASQVVDAIHLAAKKMTQILENSPGPFIVGISLKGSITFVDAPKA